MPLLMGILPPLPDFKCGGLLPFRGKRIVACVTAIPAKFIGGFNRQVECIIVCSIYKDHFCPKDQQLRDLCPWSRFGREDDRFLPHRRRHPCEGCTCVTC